MHKKLQKKLCAARTAVSSLLDECTKGSPIYEKHHQAAAQLNRTGKWLLNAIIVLEQWLDSPQPAEDKQAS